METTRDRSEEKERRLLFPRLVWWLSSRQLSGARNPGPFCPIFPSSCDALHHVTQHGSSRAAVPVVMEKEGLRLVRTSSRGST